MGRKKKEKYPDNFIGNVLIYNDEFINYRKAFIMRSNEEMQTISYCDIGDPMKHELPDRTILTMETSCYECLDNIELDPTTMKRIAAYNKTQECKKLDKKIKEKEKKIKELDNKLQDKEKRWKKIKDFVADIFEIDIDDDDDDNYYYDY